MAIVCGIVSNARNREVEGGWAIGSPFCVLSHAWNSMGSPETPWHQTTCLPRNAKATTVPTDSSRQATRVGRNSPTQRTARQRVPDSAHVKEPSGDQESKDRAQ